MPLPMKPEGPAVLLVNDQPSQLVAMDAALESAGYRIVRASSGREALRCVLEDDFAVIVLDVRMPDLDGFDTARLLRQRPRLEATPIIFATAAAITPEDARRGYALGAVDYLVAPFDADMLRAKVARFVELHESARTIRALNVALEEGLARAVRLNEELELEVGERKRAEAELTEKARLLEAAVEELEAYDYSVAHDLRAPLRAIIGYATVLQHAERERLSEQSRALLDRMVAAATRMSALIDGLLALSRAGRVEIERTPVDMSEVARETLDRLAQEHPNRRVEVTVQDGLIVSADAVLFSILMQNLLDNAWKFTRLREVARIEVGSREQDGQTVYYVRDDGVGFEMQYVGQLFQTFRRLHRVDEFEGTGTGLATARRIVERHGGRVWAEGAPDAGATFSFTLPAPT